MDDGGADVVEMVQARPIWSEWSLLTTRRQSRVRRRGSSKTAR